MALLTWMYLSAYAFVFGAELNSEIEHQTAKDSTTGSPEPMGERGAWAADNVATDDTRPGPAGREARRREADRSRAEGGGGERVERIVTPDLIRGLPVFSAIAGKAGPGSRPG